MIISRQHANRLVKSGRAILHGSTTQNGIRYQIVHRTDLQRVDHVCRVLENVGLLRTYQGPRP